jgi:hypothetical protein
MPTSDQMLSILAMAFTLWLLGNIAYWAWGAIFG